MSVPENVLDRTHVVFCAHFQGLLLQSTRSFCLLISLNGPGNWKPQSGVRVRKLCQTCKSNHRKKKKKRQRKREKLRDIPRLQPDPPSSRALHLLFPFLVSELVQRECKLLDLKADVTGLFSKHAPLVSSLNCLNLCPPTPNSQPSTYACLSSA